MKFIFALFMVSTAAHAADGFDTDWFKNEAAKFPEPTAEDLHPAVNECDLLTVEQREDRNRAINLNLARRALPGLNEFIFRPRPTHEGPTKEWLELQLQTFETSLRVAGPDRQPIELAVVIQNLALPQLLPPFTVTPDIYYQFLSLTLAKMDYQRLRTYDWEYPALVANWKALHKAGYKSRHDDAILKIPGLVGQRLPEGG